MLNEFRLYIYNKIIILKIFKNYILIWEKNTSRFYVAMNCEKMQFKYSVSNG